MTKLAIRIASLLLALTAIDASPPPQGANTGSEARLVTWGGNVYVDSSNNTILGPPSDLAKPKPVVTPVPSSSLGSIPPQFIRPATTTGPYRRVFSRPGFSYVSAIVTLPCTAARLRGEGDKDLNVGFVYTGGWGAGTTGAAVDAGFQKSSFQSPKQREHYTLFVAFASYFTRNGILKYKTNPQDRELQAYPCGQDVSLTFFPNQNRVLQVQAVGTDQNGKTLQQSIAQPTIPQDGWDASGGGTQSGIELKRMVSIAQRPGDTISGNWYFGHSSNSTAPLVRWRAVQIGHSAANAHPWSMADTYACQNVPDDSIFRVSFQSYAEEAVALDLDRTNPIGHTHTTMRGSPSGCG